MAPLSKRNRYGRLAIIMTLAMLGVGRSANAGGIIVEFLPQDTTVGLGDTFTVDVVATILMEDSIVTWGMDVWFDNSILAHDPTMDVAIGPLWTPSPAPGDGDGLAGLVLPPQLPVNGDSVLLATLTFEAVDFGTTDLLGSLTDGDPLELFVQVGGNIVAVTFISGSVTVVPLPPAIWAGLSGLGCVIVAKRRRRARR